MKPRLRFARFLFLFAFVGCAAESEPSQESEEAVAEVTAEEPEVEVQPQAEEEVVVLEELPAPEGPDGAYAIAQVMQLAHENRLFRQLFKESPPPEVAERLLLLYESLPKQEPPKGDAESWEMRSQALVSATSKIIAGDPKGASDFRRAVNCNSCHSRHRP